MNDSSGIAEATQSFPPQSESSIQVARQNAHCMAIRRKILFTDKNIVVSSPQFPGTAYKRKNSVMAQEIELKFIVDQNGVDALRQHLQRAGGKAYASGSIAEYLL
ncbi:hypothetical protein ACLK2E_16795 [Escherichia coli]